MCKAVLGRQGPARMILKLKCRYENNFLYAVLTYTYELEPEPELRFLVSYWSLGILRATRNMQLTHPPSRTIVPMTLVSDWREKPQRST